VPDADARPRMPAPWELRRHRRATTVVRALLPPRRRAPARATAKFTIPLVHAWGMGGTIRTTLKRHPGARRAAKTPFRPDVEGLRAVAIAIVVLAHAELGFGAGGFVGVDVFFVISGFLITQALVTELDRTGRVGVARFYARRVKRLMPQVLAVIAAVVVAAWVLLSPVDGEAVADDVVAAGAYAMNWHLSAEAVDYFASGSSDQPLDHLWSLAVEEQFYVVWPWLLVALAWRRRLLLPALAVVAAASFLYAARQVRVAPEAAYYSAFSRAWELGLGALAAVLLAGRGAGPRWAAVYGWLGFAAIGGATVAFGSDTPFPGPAALLPTLGAVALIVAGTCVRPAAATRSLMLGPVRWLGRVSYAWYVWHWPVLVFAGAGSSSARAAVALASLLPAWLTYRWIEEPLRRSTLHLRRPRITLAAGLAGPAVAVGVGFALSASLSSPPALAASEAEGAPQLARTGAIQRTARALRPRPRDAGADRGRAYYDGCLVDKPVTQSPTCSYGDRGSRTTVVLFGDSHAMQYFPALERIATGRRWRLIELTKGGCPPARVRVLYPGTPRENPVCDVWRENTLRRIEGERPALVVVGSSVRYTVLEGARRLGTAASTRALGAGYGPTLARLRAAAGRVAVLTDAPRPPQNIPSCVSGAMRKLRRCAFTRGPAVVRASAIEAAVARVGGVAVVDATNQFCLARLCPAVVGDVLVYRNSGHITASYMATMRPWLERQPALRLPSARRGAAARPAAPDRSG
jgi:peptidoglycan/LPS O-acetylase OafA/YrhL